MPARPMNWSAPPPMSQIEIAETFGRALQRDVRAEAEPVEAWDERARGAGMDDHQRETLIKMFQAYAARRSQGQPQRAGMAAGTSARHRSPRLPRGSAAAQA